MKSFLSLVIVALLAGLAFAEEPSVTHYNSIKEDSDNCITSGELILKVNNPTDRTFYVLGITMTDIPYQVEIVKNGKWSVVPSRRCGTGMSVRPFLAHSYIVFTPDEAPLSDPDVTFRIRVYLYIEPDIRSLYTEPNKKPWVDFVSPTFNSNDFRQKRDGDIKLPRLPGVEPIPGIEPTPK